MTTRKTKQQRDVDEQRLLAMDAVVSHLMVADADFNITYVNPSLQQMLKDNAEEIQANVPGFDPDRVVGTNIDVFHRQPERQRAMLTNLARRHTANLEVGELRFRLQISPLQSQGVRAGYAVEWHDRTAEVEAERLTRDNARIREALDHAQTMVMIADADFNIVYLNHGLEVMLAEAEAEIRREIPGFDVGRLRGTNIDTFHKNPAHQRALLPRLRAPHRARLELGGLTFSLTVIPVRDVDDSVVGYSVEWENKTEQLDAERQVNAVIDAAAAGELDRRIDTSSYAGFMHDLGDSINRLIEVVVAPIRETISVSKALADGDLSVAVKGDFHGEFGELKTSVNAFIESFNDLLRQAKTISDEVAGAGGQVRATSRELAVTSESQSEAVTESTAALTQAASQARANSENAQVANQLVHEATEAAEVGQGRMADMATSMSEIADSSRQISKIIKVIDEIAFQTNLLALNAAVEAARAGKYGKGFAVVAQEVRTLAQRSAQAAKETAEIIESSQATVGKGVEISDATSEALGRIVSHVMKVRDLVGEIASSSNEQSEGIVGVQTAMVQLANGAQTAASHSTELAAAAEQMGRQTEALIASVARFKLAKPEASAEEDLLGQLSPDMMKRLLALLQSSTPENNVSPPHAPRAAASGGGRTAADVLPFDDDFGPF